MILQPRRKPRSGRAAAGVPVVADLDDLYPGYEAALPNIDFLITSRDIPARLTGEQRFARRRCRILPALRLPSDRGNFRPGRCAGVGWREISLRCRLSRRTPSILPARATSFTPDSSTAYLQGWPLQRQLEFACAAAALNCTAMGARGAIRSVEEIEAIISAGPRHPAAF